MSLYQACREKKLLATRQSISHLNHASNMFFLSAESDAAFRQQRAGDTAGTDTAAFADYMPRLRQRKRIWVPYFKCFSWKQIIYNTEYEKRFGETFYKIFSHFQNFIVINWDVGRGNIIKDHSQKCIVHVLHSAQKRWSFEFVRENTSFQNITFEHLKKKFIISIHKQIYVKLVLTLTKKSSVARLKETKSNIKKLSRSAIYHGFHLSSAQLTFWCHA